MLRRYLSFTIGIFLIGCSASFAETIEVHSTRIKAYDEIRVAPQHIEMEQPASDAYLGETLQKLPGLMIRATSGFGSATTAISNTGLGSGSTSVSIDGIPVVETSGRGLNFSLFPSVLVDSIENQSAFAVTDDMQSALPLTTGGRVNLKTLGYKRAKESKKNILGSVLFGSGSTVEATFGVGKFAEARSTLVAGSVYNTKGNFQYKDPKTEKNLNRDHNDSFGVGSLLKQEFHFENDTTISTSGFASHQERTNPGSLEFPTRQHQRDSFFLGGVSVNCPKCFHVKSGEGELDRLRVGVFGKLSLIHSRTATFGPSTPFGDRGESTDSRSNGVYVQTGTQLGANHLTTSLAVDHQYDQSNKDEGVFRQQITGVSVNPKFKFGVFTLSPYFRLDDTEVFSPQYDAAASLQAEVAKNSSLAFSFGHLHTYPSITAISGFQNGGFVVLPNRDLFVQRDRLTTLTYTLGLDSFTLYSSVFFDSVLNRSTFSITGPMSAQFLNSSEVRLFGSTLNLQYFLNELLQIHQSLTLQKAYDVKTSHEMPYKARAQGFTSLSLNLSSDLAVTLQEQYCSKRLVATTGVDAVSAYAQTILRLDYSLWTGVLFLKVTNLFNTGWIESPGFPAMGRTYWAGYTYGK